MRISVINYILSANLVPLMAVTVLLVFVCSNPLFVKKQSKRFILAIVAIMIAIVAQSVDTMIALKVIVGENLHIVRRFTSFLNFSLSPFIAFTLLFIFNNGKFNKLYYVPLIANTLCCFASMFWKLVFYIEFYNTYARGVLFFLPFATSVFYVVMLMAKKQSFKTTFKLYERAYLMFCILMMAVGMLLEIELKLRFFSWDFSAMVFVGYYLLINIEARVTDSLTGIYNRGMLEEATQRYDGKKECMICVIDLNDFKRINDTLGHNEGDKILIKFAAILTVNMKKIARVYRMGGDEFVCLCTRKAMPRFDSAIERVRVDCKSCGISFAWGISQYDTNQEMSKAIKDADERMYKAKQMQKSEKDADERMYKAKQMQKSENEKAL